MGSMGFGSSGAAAGSVLTTIAQPDDDEDDGRPHAGAERGEIGAHAAGEPLEPEVQSPDVRGGFVLPGDVLKFEEIWVM